MNNEAQSKDTRKDQRETGMMCIAGVQGVGKTYLNMHDIYDYVRDKFHNGVKGRKCLIFDTNGEYTKEQFERNGINNFEVKKIAIKDINEWGRSPVIECRRIDAKNLSIKEKKACIEYIIKKLRDSAIILEDINTYILSITHMEDIVGGLVNLRHRGVDVFISYQRLRAIDTVIYANSRWIRLHYQTDNAKQVESKINNPELFKIAQCIVNNRYFGSTSLGLPPDKRFYVYIYNFDNKIEGDFTKREFLDACNQYLNTNKKQIKEYEDMYNCSNETAINALVKQCYKQYYGNS